MDVKKCDRCKNYYDNNIGTKQICGYSVRGISICTNASNKHYDLCDSCIDDLYEFININKED